MSDVFKLKTWAMDVDSMLSLDEEISSAVYSSLDTTFQPVAIGITQISPNGIDDEVDRYLLAPTPPLVMTQHDVKMASFLSPTNAEPTFSFNAPLSSAVVAKPFQSDHRHVTPIPVEILSPVSSLNTAGRKGVVTNLQSHVTVTDTTDISVPIQEVNVALVQKIPSGTSGKIQCHAMYNDSICFPVIVHRMITETCNQYDDLSLFHWTDCGNYFWIHQTHSLLSTVLSKYFKHNQYQSLRRQLNAYGFGKIISGKVKGYWYHPNFFRDSQFETLKSIISVPRIHGRKTKNGSKRSNLSKACDAKVKNNAQIKKNGKRAPVEVKALSSTRIAVMNGSTPDDASSEEAVNHEDVAYQLEDLYKTKFYTGDRRKGMTVLEEKIGVSTMAGIASNAKVVSSLMEDPCFSDPIPDLNFGLPLFCDDLSYDALTTLATVASFLPIVPTPLYTPITKSCDVIKPVPINQAASAMNTVLPQDVNMTILVDTARWFVPTPIKLPTATDGDFFFSWNDSIDCCFDDAVSSYSVGSLSSPPKLILPFNDGSAFTPVVSSTDYMVAGFCESFK